MKKACKGHLQHVQQMLVHNYIGNVKKSPRNICIQATLLCSWIVNFTVISNF